MAIDRPKAIDDAPACGPQQREGRQVGEFLASRGMGAAQGKKLARRRCGIGDRGAAGLRPDQAIKEAVWETCDQTATKQENWRPSFIERNSAAPGETAPSSQPFRPVSRTNIADAERPHARPRQSRGLAPPAPPVPARASTAPLPGVARTIRQHSIMDQARSRATAFRMFAHVRWKPSRRMGLAPCDALRRLTGPAGCLSKWRRRRRSPRRSRRSGMPMTIKIVMKASVARRVSTRTRRTLAPSKERRDAKESGKNGRRRKSMRTSAAERACSKPGQAQGSNSWITISGSPSYSAVVMTPKSSSPARKTTTQVMRVVARLQPQA